MKTTLRFTALFISFFTGVGALAASRLPAPQNAELKSTAPVYALVELSQTPTAAHFGQQLRTSSNRTQATSAAVQQLSAVHLEQGSFAQKVAAAGLSNTHEIYRL